MSNVERSKCSGGCPEMRSPARGPEVAQRPLDEHHHVGVLDHHALRRPGGARGEQKVRRVASRAWARRGFGRNGREIAPTEGGCRGSRRPVSSPKANLPQSSAGIAGALSVSASSAPAGSAASMHRGSQAWAILASRARRAGGIHRNINTACLQRSQEARDCRDGLGRQNADAISLAAAGGQQQPGEPVTQFIELRHK